MGTRPGADLFYYNQGFAGEKLQAAGVESKPLELNDGWERKKSLIALHRRTQETSTLCAPGSEETMCKITK